MDKVKNMPAEENGQALAEEDDRVRQLRLAVDLSLACIYQEPLEIDEALDMMNSTRKLAGTLFPEDLDKFDLIYKPRFLRALKQRFPGASTLHKAEEKG